MYIIISTVLRVGVTSTALILRIASRQMSWQTKVIGGIYLKRMESELARQYGVARWQFWRNGHISSITPMYSRLAVGQLQQSTRSFVLYTGLGILVLIQRDYLVMNYHGYHLNLYSDESLATSCRGACTKLPNAANLY